MTIPNIDREHPEYIGRSAAWNQWKAFGSPAGSRAATLLPLGPVLHLAGGISAPKHFYTSFAHNCDLKGTSLGDFFRRAMQAAFVCGSSPVVVDFAGSPAKEGMPPRAYLIAYRPDELINWNYDETGKLNWAVLRTSCRLESEITQARWERETRWIRYGRTHFQLYRRAGENGRMELIEKGQHGLARLRQVPVFQLRAHHDAYPDIIRQVLSAVAAARQDKSADLGALAFSVRRLSVAIPRAIRQP